VIDKAQHRRIQEALRRGEPIAPQELMEHGVSEDRELFKGPQVLTPDRKRHMLITGMLSLLLSLLFLAGVVALGKPRELSDIVPLLFMFSLAAYSLVIGFRITRHVLRSKTK